MQEHWVTGEGNNKLAVIVLGWASGPGLISHIRPPGYDIVILSDYRDIGEIIKTEGKTDLLKRTILSYPVRTLTAWSFGVWVAERLLGGIDFDKATALNGTPFPADEESGIGARRLAVTIRGLQKGGMEPFNRKAYGDWHEIASSEQQLNSGDYIEELETLTALSSQPFTPTIDWNTAIVATGDAIFPPENMLRYWGSRAKTVNLPHYPFGDNILMEELF